MDVGFNCWIVCGYAQNYERTLASFRLAFQSIIFYCYSRLLPVLARNGKDPRSNCYEILSLRCYAMASNAICLHHLYRNILNCGMLCHVADLQSGDLKAVLSVLAAIRESEMGQVTVCTCVCVNSATHVLHAKKIHSFSMLGNR